jgi:DNA modification methylase
MTFREVQLDGGRIRLICGDCLEVLPTLSPGSVDAVVTDPPPGMFNPGNLLETKCQDK